MSSRRSGILAMRPPNRPLQAGWRRASRAATQKEDASVPELGAPANDELLERRAHALIDRRLLVGLERLAPDLAGPLGRIAAAHPRPAVEVLGRGQQRAVKALA